MQVFKMMLSPSLKRTTQCSLIFLIGNIKKSKQLLEKAAECRAVPLEMLEIALRNLSLQKNHLLSDEEKENLAGEYLK